MERISPFSPVSRKKQQRAMAYFDKAIKLLVESGTEVRWDINAIPKEIVGSAILEYEAADTVTHVRLDILKECSKVWR